MITLVTGATGMVGFNIVKSLLNQKRKVKVLVRSIEKAKRILPAECELIKGDIIDLYSIEKAMDGCEVIYHAAGFPEQWMKNTDIFDEVNVGGTRNMIHVALKNNIKRFIYTSTIDVFFAGNKESYNESIIDPFEKGTYYERSKQRADWFVSESLQKGLPAIFLHPAAVYGQGPTDSPGTNDLIYRLINKKVPLLLPGGYPIVYSDDIGKGHILAETKARVGERFILSDAYYSLHELASMILEELNNPYKVPKVMALPIVKFISSAGEIFSQISNKPPLIPKGQLHFLQWQAKPVNNKAVNELGWTPTPAKEGIKKTIEFILNN